MSLLQLVRTLVYKRLGLRRAMLMQGLRHTRTLAEAIHSVDQVLVDVMMYPIDQ